MAYDPNTYLPGDAWTSLDFMSRALTTPKLVVTDATVAATTTPSFFEFRQGKGDAQQVQVSVIGTGLSVVLERSFDNGDTWQIVETYSAAVEKSIPYTYPVKLRLRVISGTGLTLGLRQQLA